jgi:hypothetical protein
MDQFQDGNGRLTDAEEGSSSSGVTSMAPAQMSTITVCGCAAITALACPTVSVLNIY